MNQDLEQKLDIGVAKNGNMIKLKTILNEAGRNLNTKTTPLKDYPVDVQKQYNDYLKTWGKEMADSYLEREDLPNDTSKKTLEQNIYDNLKTAKQDTAKEMKQKGYGADKYPVVLFKNLSTQLRKIGKITDAQINRMINTDSITTIWAETKYLLKIFSKQK
jgi:hypothetical protein